MDPAEKAKYEQLAAQLPSMSAESFDKWHETQRILKNMQENECVCNWRASEASETLSGVTNGNRRYIYMVRARHFSSAGPVLRNVGGVKCEPFLKHSNYL